MANGFFAIGIQRLENQYQKQLEEERQIKLQKEIIEKKQSEYDQSFEFKSNYKKKEKQKDNEDICEFLDEDEGSSVFGKKEKSISI